MHGFPRAKWCPQRGEGPLQTGNVPWESCLRLPPAASRPRSAQLTECFCASEEMMVKFVTSCGHGCRGPGTNTRQIHSYFSLLLWKMAPNYCHYEMCTFLEHVPVWHLVVEHDPFYDILSLLDELKGDLLVITATPPTSLTPKPTVAKPKPD